ncbi:TetR/AcrR family transcriptional regulator [Sphingomonas sp.]|uniref:TetR/AcrR family transcriptional regulator n=1 Tax=Sphingomonas sp. TaxID=28214 RepID=UPI001B233CA8|nr:TetR/AcrR family transcriptional regulator [Sphingomonas sp.]MBO9712915.1 TetR/AcrR family transcriptional regulator [Sphingomonas sp.]
MPRLKAGAMAERRQRIALAAYRCFVREGFAAASVDSICAEAGISKGAFYVHFKSKEALVHAVAELRSEAIPPLPGDSAETLADAIVELLIGGMIDVKAARFELEAMMASIADSELGTRARANLDAIRDRIAEALARFGNPANAEGAMTFCLGVILRSGTWTPPERDAVREALARLLSA